MADVTLESLMTAHRPELLLHCYRLLGSLTDAEDVLQETFLAAWRGLDSFEHRASPRSWLYRIATNRCLNALRDRRRRIPPAPEPPFEPPRPSRRGDVPWLQPYPDALLEQLPGTEPGPETRYTAREAIELAFVAALQRLPPRQAAALVLCDVLGHPLDEAASLLGTTPTAVKGLRQRARAALGRCRGDAHAAPPDPGSAQERELVRRFADAFSTDDVDTVIGLLTDDAWLAMPPAPHEYQGIAAIGSFLRASAAWRAGRRLRLHSTRANGQPAFVCRLDGAVERPAGLIVLTLAGGRVHAITRFLDDRVMDPFGPTPDDQDRSATP
ncbi:RNA polymerase subunit sigma-70 [Actinoallomurus soli]|uniref:RNA polymerase subunit sigma-70 n=1 Tax=Actinoallomurus soli TaxID=2952535 RepID=UPI002092047E|nr:RNA polymerase subunit sigma-70 [Actinoallomurus soli]MCO5968448.1 RNA polymerase subunit sigma-70 [Actinoallomurus soli]